LAIRFTWALFVVPVVWETEMVVVSALPWGCISQLKGSRNEGEVGDAPTDKKQETHHSKSKTTRSKRDPLAGW